MGDQRIARKGGGVKTKTRTALVLAAIVVALANVAAELKTITIDAHQIGNNFVVRGYTGHLLGEEIIIKGHKYNYALRRDGRVGGVFGNGDRTFVVEAINDKKDGLSIQVEGIESWPDQTAATLRGYEQCSIRYLQADDSKPPKGPDFKPYQEAFTTFHVTEIIEPKTLQLGNENKSDPAH